MKEEACRKNILSKLREAIINSVSGLGAVLKERAFQMEAAAYIALLLLLVYLRLPAELTWRLILVNTLVLITEIINTAIETIVDLVSPEYNKLAKTAKDLGSAAVFVSILFACATWAWTLISL
jgi:diacylglycerol kinase (ATP)